MQESEGIVSHALGGVNQTLQAGPGQQTGAARQMEKGNSRGIF